MSMPHFDYRPLGRLHKVNASTGKASKKAMKAKEAKIRARESEEIAVHTGTILAQSNQDIYALLSNAGKGKSSVHKAIFSLFSANAPFQARDGQIGDRPGPPIIVSKNSLEAKSEMAKRSNRMAPTIVVVDLLMCLQSLPPRRPKKRDGGHRDLNIREVARDIIVMMYDKHCKFDENVSLIVLCMDVNSTSSRIRLIARENRGNTQKSNQTNYQSSERIRSATEPLSSVGEFSDLMRRDKDGFVVFLAEEIANQLNSGNIEQDQWDPGTMFRRVNFAFVGGSKDAHTIIGNDDIQVTSMGLPVSRDALERRTSHVVNQGEGERMIFTWLREFVSEAFSCNSVLDCRIHIHCADSDALAGLSQYFVHSLSEYCKQNESAQFTGAMILQCHNKSVGHVMSLPRKYQESLLGSIPENVVPTGNGFIWEVDCISLYESLEQHPKLQHLPTGHRAIAATAAMHSIVNNDYIASDGVSHAEFLKALMSDQLVMVSRAFGASACSPVAVHPVRFDKSMEDHDNDSGVNLSGALLVFGAIVLGRKRVRQVLSRKFTPSQLKRFLLDQGWDVLMAASHISGDPTRAPDPLSMLCQLSCVNFVLRQWLVCTYQRQINPAVGRNELNGTCYDIPNVLVQGKSCSVEYDLLRYAKEPKELKRMQSDAGSLREHLSRKRFGRIFLEDQLSQEGKLWLFDPLDACRRAIDNGGIYPITRVDANDVLSKYEADSYEKLESIVEQHWTLFKDNDTTPDDRAHARSSLQKVYETTLCANTGFNERGFGSPLLVNNSPVDISESRKNGKRGRGLTRWPEGCSDLASKPVKDLFPLLWKEGGSKVYALLNKLCKHVFEYRDGDLTAIVRAADRINELLDDEDDEDNAEEHDDLLPEPDDDVDENGGDPDNDEEEEDELEGGGEEQ